MATQPLVLIVEDDNIIVMEIQGRLEDLGYAVAGTAATGSDAVAKAIRLQPDLVLMDIRLRGDMDGIEAARHIRARVDVPVIYLTAYADQATLERAKIAEPYGYLIKPFQERELHSAIEIALYKHRMERELRENRAWLNTVLKSIGDGVIATGGEGHVAFLNTVAAELTGWDQTPALQGRLDDVFHICRDGVEVTSEILTQQARDRHAIATEATLIARDGAEIPIEYSVAPIQQSSETGIVLAFRDITERKEAEVELAHRLAQAQTLRDVMLAAASTLQFDQVLERTVTTLRAKMGLEFVSFVIPTSDGEALKLHPSQIGFGELVEKIEIPMDASVTGRAYRTADAVLVSDVSACEYYYEGVPGIGSELALPVHVAGEVHGVLDLESRQTNAFSEVNIKFYTAIAGQLSVALQNAGLYREVTRHARELTQALQQLQQLDDLKSEFIQNVSHELRMPITLIKGYSTLLANGEMGPLSPEQQSAVDVVARRADMMGDLIEDILVIMMAERGHSEFDKVALDTLAQSVVADFRFRAEEAGLELFLEIAEDLPPVRGFRTDLERVLDNLLGNALKFTPTGGNISVRLAQHDSTVSIEIADTGIGIPPEEHARIFERFYQVDGSPQRRYGGTGLGLALVKEVVESCGGRVYVDSEVGRGTTFTVTLPAYTKT